MIIGHLISVTFLTFVEFGGSNEVHITHLQSIRQELRSCLKIFNAYVTSYATPNRLIFRNVKVFSA